MPSPYARSDSTARPFRIWNATDKKHERGRAYSHERHALDGALILCRWSKVGQWFEVYDVTTGRLLAQYARMTAGIKLIKG